MRVLVFAAAAALVFVSVGASARTFRVEKWPADVDTIPCSAWSHTPDGTWALNGSIQIGASVIDDVGFKGDSTAHLLDRKCGKK
jgi:hypothetical protein